MGGDIGRFYKFCSLYGVVLLPSGKTYVEIGPFVENALDVDAAFHLGHISIDRNQPQAKAEGLSIDGVRSAENLLEELLLAFFADAYAIVCHMKSPVLAFAI